MHIFASISLLVVASQYVDSLPSKLPESIGKSQTTPSSSTKFANNSSISMDGNNQYLDNIKKRLLDELDMETRPDRIPQDRQFPIGPKIEYNKQQLESDVESHPRIVFATLVTKGCPTENGHIMCVSFIDERAIPKNFRFVKISLKIPHYSTSSYARQVNSSNVRRLKYNSNIYVTHLAPPGNEIASSSSVHGKTGLVWTNIQLTNVNQNVENLKILNTVLKIECVGCTFKKPNNIDEYPVLTFQVSKPKQTPNNCDSSTSGCCRENYELDWGTLGWSDWIVLPEILEIGRCVGTCDHITYEKPVNRKKTSHENLLKVIDTRFLKTDSSRTLCCGPTKFGSAKILYTNGKQASMKTLQNAVILECGCA